MHADLQEDERLTRFTKVCLGFPKTERQMMGLHASFRVKKKTFAYFVNDHHGDGIVGVLCKVLPGDNAALIKADPARFYMPAYVGPRGWVGLRLDVGRVNWKEVEELARGSFQLVTGKGVD
ncbi:MmcQ/YjbR family DNA-binding protein [Tunturibacter empetritectus]|uniref:DNA-binding protein (MmcQ/YjbR family) n=1 Tax=Tunturiibacter lichenicola TaxID=2051959 RepID=A0A7W8J5C7_9BACT|nr:MmcQ/YjbR family DNA-binding protein [Edaphobacter lichenicola]MBB5342939.1 putative DNA-binding protein (MmcQ/YjbR family) [Edaphobacter lichenicola]